MILFPLDLWDHLQIIWNAYCLFVFTLDCCPKHLNNCNKIIIELRLDKLSGNETEYIFHDSWQVPFCDCSETNLEFLWQ